MKMRLKLETKDKREVYWPFDDKSEAAAKLHADHEVKLAEANFKEPLTLLEVQRARKRPPPCRIRHGLDFGTYDFEFTNDGVRVHRKNTLKAKATVVPFRLIATGGGVEFEVDGKIYRAGLDENGLAVRQMTFGARVRHINWKRLAWFAGCELEEPDQLEWTKAWDIGLSKQ